MTLAGRPIQRSGDAPVPPARPAKVELGRMLKGVHVQAQDGPIRISWDGKNWIDVGVGPAQHFWISAPFVYVSAPAAPAKYSIVGALV